MYLDRLNEILFSSITVIKPFSFSQTIKEKKYLDKEKEKESFVYA
jgi:hypothetical protein